MTSPLWPIIEGRRVLLGVSGGIAAYKAAELCRLLVRAGTEVQVMMTAAARRFVGEATFAALSGRGVATDLFDPEQEARVGHIRLAERAEALVLAPATAHLIGRIAHGLADDLVTTVYLACTAPVVLAPAMNVHMWEHPATRDNVARLRHRGHRIVGPDAGELACGHEGAGRMADPEAILQAVGAALSPHDLAGRSLVVTAGGTREPLDPVRFLGNRSTGKMGHALAAEAAARGAQVLLVSGPTSLPAPYGVRRVAVESAAEMAAAVRDAAPGADAVIMAAAVADYRPASRATAKLKKADLGDTPALPLARTDDILAALGAARGPARRPVLVGFAAETGGLEAAAAGKLAAKGCDLLVANDVTTPGAGFGTDTNAALILDAAGGREEVPLTAKRALAARVLARVAELLRGGGVDEGRQRPGEPS